MEVIYREGSRKTLDESDDEVRDAVAAAIKLTEDKRGFRTIHEVWRDCQLIVTIGHNIYTTNIHIIPSNTEKKRRRDRWHNGYAYFCNGVFWANWSRIRVELI